MNLTQYGKKLSPENLQAAMKYFQKYKRQGDLTTYFFNYASLCISKYKTEIKCCSLLFPTKGDLRINKNYRDITNC